MCLVMLGCLLDTRHMWVLASSGLGLVPVTPQNSSGGVSVASLQWLSERAPSLVTVWTLVALWSVLGEHVCWVGSTPARGAGLPECVGVLAVVLGSLCLVGISGQHCFREQHVGPQGHLAPRPGAVGVGLSRGGCWASGTLGGTGNSPCTWALSWWTCQVSEPRAQWGHSPGSPRRPLWARAFGCFYAE